jgi:hypothetical protein
MSVELPPEMRPEVMYSVHFLTTAVFSSAKYSWLASKA